MSQDQRLYAPTTEDSPLVYLSTHYIQAKEYLETIVTSISDAICTTDMKGRVVYFGPGAEKMLGRPARSIVGRRAHTLYQEGRSAAQRIMKALLRRGSVSGLETVMLGDRRLVHVSMSAALLRDRSGRVIGTLGVSKDITERVELERRLRELSITDNLTGLHNQRHFRDRLPEEMRRASRQRQALSLILFDLDRFKEINDTHGHLQGDRVLLEVARTLKQSIRAGVDGAFRYGGDEFVALLPGMDLSRARGVIRRLRLGLRQADPGGRPVAFSAGCAALRSGDTPDSLLRRADARMYAAKRRHCSAPSDGNHNNGWQPPRPPTSPRA